VLVVLAAAVWTVAADIEPTTVVADLEMPIGLFGGEVPLGGLSGLTFDPACGVVYAVTDDRGYIAPPRIYVFELALGDVSVRPLEVVTLRDERDEPFARGLLDPESIALTPDGIMWVGTEGEAHRGVAPRILGFRLDGLLVAELEIPPAYLPGDGRGVRSNHGFEGLSVTPDGSRIVAAVESALLQDGPDADLEHGTVVRILVFDAQTRRAIAERAYRVEAVPDEPRPPDAYRSIGVSEILALDRERALVLERSFSAGVGNTVRIFLADLATGDDVTGVASLPAAVEPVRKTLVADLAELGIDPDNLEGLSFGPALADGRATLVLVADDNFQPEVQSNQLVVLAVDGIDAPGGDRVAASVARVQGPGHVSPLVGRCVRAVEGTVTAVLGRRTGQAFWIQQQPGDDDPATSEGLFVTALDGLPEVAVGDDVRLTGRVEEPMWGMELPVTRIVADGLVVSRRGVGLPAPLVMGAGGRPIPTPNIDDDGLDRFDPDRDSIDFYESLEGMLVRVEDPVVVGPTSRHGEIVVLGDDGSDARPRSSSGGVVLTPGNSHPERIVIDDRLVAHPPAVRVGDRLTGPIDGVLHYSYGSYKVLNTEPLSVAPGATVDPRSTTLTADGDHFTVATFNVENLFASSDQTKFAALAEIVVRRLGGPAVLALQEIQDDTGPEDDGTVGAEATLGRLVEAVVTAGGPRYRFAQIDPENNADGGRPGGNIRVALLFDPARVELVAPDDTRLVANPTRLGATDSAFADSRKPLAVELEIDGTRVTVIVCHLRSKGGDDPLFGRRQPPVRSSELQRAAQAELIREFVDLGLDGSPDGRIVILGDLNDFEFSGSVGVLAAPPMVNLVERIAEQDRWSYVYLGNSQTLDHIIVSPALAGSVEVEVVHVNAEFPASEQASDHDPIIARFKLGY